MKKMYFSIITFYQFKKNHKIDNIQKKIKNFCSFHKIRGTVLIAKEGINGTVAGLEKTIKLFALELENIGFTRLEKKVSKTSHKRTIKCACRSRLKVMVWLTRHEKSHRLEILCSPRRQN